MELELELELELGILRAISPCRRYADLYYLLAVVADHVTFLFEASQGLQVSASPTMCQRYG